MRTCLWKVAVGMALFGFVVTLEVSANALIKSSI
jgi:hypothetical protein